MEQQNPVARGRARGRGRDRGRGRALREQDAPRPGQADRQQQDAGRSGPPAAQGPPPPAAQGPPPPAAQGPPPQAAHAPPPQGAQAPPPQAAQAPHPGGAAGPAMMAGGRAARRGTSRPQEPRPGDQQVEELERRMEGAAIGAAAVGAAAVGPAGEGPPVQGARPARRSQYQDREFRPEELQSKRGLSGRPVVLRGNFYQLRTPPNWRICQYRVDFLPPCESQKMKKGLLYSHPDVIGPVKAFDGTILYLPFRLEHDETVVYSNRRADNANIKITIRYTCEMVDINPSTIHVLNVIWRKILGMMNMKQIQRHFFDIDKKIQVPAHGLEVMPGFQTSILRYETNLLLDIDITHKIMRTETVLDHLYRLEQQFARAGREQEEFTKQAEKELVGTIVMTRYNNKSYRVDDIDFRASVDSRFDRHGNMISYVEYYKGQYDITIRDHRQPLLVTRAKSRDLRAGAPHNIYLVPELCLPTGLTETGKSDYNLRRDLATHTRINPEVRINRLQNFIRDLKGNQAVADELRNWNLDLAENLVSIPSRRLNPETLEMFDDSGSKKVVQLEYNADQADWSQDMRGKAMKLSVNLKEKEWVLITPKQCTQNGRSLIQSLQRVAGPMGMKIANPEMREIAQDRGDMYLREMRGAVGSHIKLVVCVLPNNRKDRYDAIKKFCCIDRPVPSQMVTNKTLSNPKRLMSVATKIAIQINCKLGGVVWTTPIPLKGTMIVGFDSYHDSSMRGRTAGGVVATISADFARYHSSVTFQMTHLELLNKLQASLVSCLRAFVKENGMAPEKVIVYRDGVGDNQLDQVYDFEIPQIKSTIGGAKLGFVVVKKRTNARFFFESSDQGPQGRGDPRGRGGGAGAQRCRYTNPGPGTVIDDVVTKPTWFDFFLISQSVREGTVTPTHYNVILNEITPLDPEKYQRLSYKLTHMYYNWQGTIRVPAPCMYAHKLAFLAGQSLHAEPHDSLGNHLFYL